MSMIFLILPSFNEEKNLVKIFKKINNLLIVKNITVILIDDCSTDNTKNIKFKKNSFKIYYKKHVKNMGLSIALETGFNIARKKVKRNDLIITMDSDNTHPIKIIPRMIDLLKKNNSDIVIASRFLPNSKVNGINFLRQCLSIVSKYVFSYLFPHKNLKEYNCNFRIYRAHLIKKLMKVKGFFKNEDFNITVKILLFLITNNQSLKIYEYPLILNYHYKIGSSKMSILKNILLTLRLIILKKF